MLGSGCPSHVQMALSNLTGYINLEFSNICIPRLDWSYQLGSLQRLQMVSEAIRLKEFCRQTRAGREERRWGDPAQVRLAEEEVGCKK